MNFSIEKIQEAILNQSAFVAWCHPGNSEIHFINTNPISISIHELNTQSGFVVFPFEGNGWCFPFEDTEDTISKKNKVEVDSANISISENEYFNLCNRFIQKIKSNKFDKLVLSRIKKIKREEHFNIQRFIEKILTIYPTTFRYIANIPNYGLWCGASPELLVEHQNNETTTMALAGTKAHEFINDDWGNKEITEQEFVLNYIQKCFSESGYTHVSISEKETIHAGRVLHLRNTFRAKTQITQPVFNLINALHPTPAVCGLPKETAKNFILQNETHQRKLYSGFLGPIYSPENLSLFVNLRCMEITKNSFDLFVGGGITAQSDSAKEFSETELKAKTIADLLE